MGYRAYKVNALRKGNEEAYDGIVRVTEEKGALGLKVYVEAWLPLKKGAKEGDKNKWDMEKLCVDMAKVLKPKSW